MKATTLKLKKKMWEILHLSWPTTPGKEYLQIRILQELFHS